MTEEKKISEYLEVLSSKAPVPGGGGASALAGALGNALGQMVVKSDCRKEKICRSRRGDAEIPD